MGKVLAARFDDFPTADSAAHALFAAGVSTEAVSVFFAADPATRGQRRGEGHQDSTVSRRYALACVAALSAMGAIFGAALILTFDVPTLFILISGPLGACAGAWLGATWLAERALAVRRERDEADALLTVHVGTDRAREVARILVDAGAEYVESDRGRWQHGQWVESDSPTRYRSPGHIRNLASF